MKYEKWAGVIVLAAGLGYAGRERWAAQRLEELQALRHGETGGFVDAKLSTSLLPAGWLDVLLDTVPTASVQSAADESVVGPDGKPRPKGPVELHNGYVEPGVKVGLAKSRRARAQRGAGLLIDSRGQRFEISPRLSSATASAPEEPPEAAPPTAKALPIDPALIQRRKDNAWFALKWSGAAGAALLLW